MSSYYNEHDPFAAAWLRELIKGGHIAPGDVDERSIADVRADDLTGYTQCHFFAGIGGWSYALRLAGWPDDRPVWTGSCPCQPFSSAGKGDGGSDHRHLWPHWARLIRECSPVAIFGEQVESAIAHGWIDAVFDDLEREGYACGAACLPAGSVGAPHVRQRVWFVGQSVVSGLERHTGNDGATNGWPKPHRPTAETGASMGDSASERGWREPEYTGLEGPSWLQSRGSSTRGWWDRAEIIECGDGKTRVTEPGICPLAHGVSARVGRLRGYGNSIVPAVAAAFIEAYMEIGA